MLLFILYMGFLVGRGVNVLTKLTKQLRGILEVYSSSIVI